MGDDRVGAGGSQIVCAQALENLVRQTVGSSQRQLERRRIRDSAAVEVGSGDFLFRGKSLNLRRRPVHQHNADVQRAKDRDIEKDVSEILIGNDRAIDADDEDFFAEARNVLQDAP